MDKEQLAQRAAKDAHEEFLKFIATLSKTKLTDANSIKEDLKPLFEKAKVETPAEISVM